MVGEWRAAALRLTRRDGQSLHRGCRATIVEVRIRDRTHTDSVCHELPARQGIEALGRQRVTRERHREWPTTDTT